MSWDWNMTQNLSKNWLVVWKMTLKSDPNFEKTHFLSKKWHEKFDQV